jgi:hypothetical protein
MIDTVPLPEKQLLPFLSEVTRDRELREKFLKDPIGVGKKYGISFTEAEVKKIRSTAGLIKSINVIIESREIAEIWRDHVIYPVPPMRYRLRIR